MKCTIPEISWHNREPVLSVDIFPEIGQSYRLASAGGDGHVLIWQLNITSNGAVSQELISDLTRHQKAVNCVRWSRTGKYLASADDDANIIIWQLKTDNIPLLEGDTGDKEIWNVFKIMRGHKEDVYDICWSIDEAKILSGSVDNTAILWDVNKGKMDHIMTDHKGFVQGVAWDPKNQFIATISTDRICRLFDTSGKHVKSRIQKGKLTSVSEGHFLKDQQAKYFHDDTFKSFFRRLQFTPDGSLLIVPSGHIEVENCNPINATLIFTLNNLSCPSVILPIPKQSSTVVRVCPVLYELHENGPDPVIKLPYRMIFAVGTDHGIILYDTQQDSPFATFRDIHYTRLTDLTWSLDGLLLIASSTDGFCSLITFELDELGVPWAKIESETEENPLEISGCEELDKDENVDTNNKDAKKMEAEKRTSFLEQWALKTPKKRRIGENAIESEVRESPMMRDAEKMDVDKPKETINKLIPRRITPIIDKNSEEKINIFAPKRIKPTFIEPLASTSKIKNSQDEEITKSDDEEESSESEEELSREEQNDYKKASQNIKQLFCKKLQTFENTAMSDTTPTSEKVNVLIPRRAKQIKAVEINSAKNVFKAELIGKEKAKLHTKELLKTGSNNFGNIEEKPIAVKPPKIEENKPKIAIRKLEEKSLVNESVANKHSDAKPGKSGILEATKDEEKSLLENKINLRFSENDAKPIAVKRKSRSLETKKVEETSSSDTSVNLNEPKNQESALNKHSDAKPIAVKSKLTESKTNKDDEKSKDESLIVKSPIKAASPKKPVFKLKFIPPKDEVDIKNAEVIDLVSSDDESTGPKKPKPTLQRRDTPRGKPQAKISNVTPRKQTTTLLNFLQKTKPPPKTNIVRIDVEEDLRRLRILKNRRRAEDERIRLALLKSNQEKRVYKSEKVLDEVVAKETRDNEVKPSLKEKFSNQDLVDRLPKNDENQDAKRLTLLKENDTKKNSSPPKLSKEEEVHKSEKVLDEVVAKETCDDEAKPQLEEKCFNQDLGDRLLQIDENRDANELLKDSDTKNNSVENKEKKISDSENNLVESEEQEIIDTKIDLVESKQKKTTDTNSIVSETQATPKTTRRVPFVTLASPSSKTKRKL